MRRVITLTTDFGLDDAFVGTIKGVIIGINPDAVIVDLCHSVQPQNISQGAFLLSTAYCYFPENTIHLVVVDPGVGSRRRAIILRTPGYLFVAPDNGLLSYVVHDFRPLKPGQSPSTEGRRVRTVGNLEAVSISNPRFWLKPTSNTFHGRDIFGPVAAHLSLGTDIYEFGDRVPAITAFTPPGPEANGGAVSGEVLHVDRYGNLTTNIKAGDLPTGMVRIEIGGRVIDGLISYYQEGGDLLALIDSSGYVEIAVKNGSAAQVLGAKAGDRVTVIRLTGQPRKPRVQPTLSPERGEG